MFVFKHLVVHMSEIQVLLSTFNNHVNSKGHETQSPDQESKASSKTLAVVQLYYLIRNIFYAK